MPAEESQTRKRKRRPGPWLSSQKDYRHADPVQTSPGMRRKAHRISEPGPSRISPEGPRRRQSSFSIEYNSDNGSSPWGFTLEFQDSGDESVYSVQSKETVIVQSSTDDYWFLDSEGESDQPMDHISVQVDQVGISLEFNQTEPSFPEEYEVDDRSGGESPHWYDTDGSESPIEEVFVVYDESDEDFWADSESSDSGNSSDDELQDGDKWTCKGCFLANNPLHRYCDRCWSVRPDWLPEQTRKPQLDGETTDFFGLHNDHEKTTSPLKQDISHLPSSAGVKQSDCSKDHEPPSLLNRTASLETLPASDIDEAAVSAYNCALSSSQTSQEYLYKPSLQTTTASAQEIYKAKIALDFACPPLKKNDSGLGCSLSNLDLPSSQEYSSLTSSQGSTGSIWKASDSAYSSLESLRDKLVRSPKTISLTVPKSSTSVVRVASPLRSPIKILHHHTITQNILSPVSHVAILKCPDEKRKKISPVKQLLSSIQSVSHQKPGTSREGSEPLQDLCTVCMVKPKEASIIHGKTGHQVCCYVCAKRLRRRGKPCPVCRRPIQRVIKNYIV